MNDNPHDLSFWFQLALCFAAALAGELYRLGSLDLPWHQIFKRAVLRYSASGLAAYATYFILLTYDATRQSAFPIAILMALAGADFALAIYNSWLRKKLGLELSTTSAQPTNQAPPADPGQQ